VKKAPLLVQPDIVSARPELLHADGELEKQRAASGAPEGRARAAPLAGVPEWVLLAHRGAGAARRPTHGTAGAQRCPSSHGNPSPANRTGAGALGGFWSM